MRSAPATIRVVLRHGMLCVGCPIASFHTIADAAREHDLDEGQLRRDLEAEIDRSDAADQLFDERPSAITKRR